MVPAREIGAIIAPMLLGVSTPVLAQQVDFQIAKQPAVTGIPEFARQARVQIVSPVSRLDSQRTRAVRGRYSVDAALAILLRGTGLRVAIRRGNVISLALARDAAKAALQPTSKRVRPRPQVRIASTKRARPEAQMQAGTESEIVVTGTRIARPELGSTMPVSILTMEDAKHYCYATVYDALTRMPSVAPGLGNANTQGEAWDVGVSNINLRHMGVNRSLVLVDGRRWVSGGARTSAVDLNSIPDAMIDRIEIVTGGAAAIYGADAVTGAVNIIMKKNITGLTLSASSGLSQRADARQTSVSATAGFDFSSNRGSLQIGGTYTHTTPLRYTDCYTNRTGFVPNTAGAGPQDGVPDNILDTDLRDLKRSFAPTIFYDDQWYTLNDGALTRTGYDYAITPPPLGTGHGGPGANAFENHVLRNKLVLGSLHSRLAYELTPTTTWAATFAYAHSYARAPSVFPEVRDDLRPTNWWGGTTGAIATLANPYLPDSLRQFMISNGLTSIPLNRTYANLPAPFEIHERDYITIGTDVAGRLTEGLNWSVFLQYGQVIDRVTTTNMIRRSAWLNARDVISDPITGQSACANLTARTAGCVPFNIFTTTRPGEAFLASVAADRHERRKNTLFTGDGGITGNLFSLPHGEVSIAAGVEWRRETLSTQDDPDAAKLADIVFKPGTDYVLHPALDAARNTIEAYGEVVVPVLRDLPFARLLSIEGAYRFSRYSDGPDTGTWKAGGTWRPVTGLTLRGVYSRSIRVPNFGELYSPDLVQTVGITDDPCSGAFFNQGPNRVRNCAALLPGVALPLPYPNTNAPTIRLSGNAELAPETSNSFTMGTVLQPEVLPGLDVTADYWNIRIANAITAIPYLNILSLCADSTSGVDNFYCDLVTRNPTGQIVSISASNYNLAAQRARGVDIGLNYSRSVGLGQFRLALNGTYLIEQTTVGSPGTDAIDYAGQWNYSRLRATLTTDYTIDRITFGLSTRFIGRSVFDVTDASRETRNPSHVPAYVSSDLSIQYRPRGRFALTFGVRNIGDVGIYGPLQDTAPGPNSSGGAQTGAAYYDAVGRYFFAKVDVKL